MAEHKLRPSKNRGPGPMNREQAGSIRNTLSQKETELEKKKVQKNLAEEAGLGLRNITGELLGTGGIKGGFLDGRNRFTPKGRPYGPLATETMNKVYTPNHFHQCENMVRRILPKYRTGNAYTIGTNFCPKPFNTRQSAAHGLMDELRMPNNPGRAQRLATHGTTMITVFTAELMGQYNEHWLAQQAAASAAAGGGAAGAAAAAAIPAPAPPSDDEVKAAIHLSLLYGFAGNRNQAPGAPLRGVTKTRNVQGL